MNAEQSFIAALLGDPKDVSLRLVYADWLEECGDARADYLRLQVELARTSADDKKRQKDLKSQLQRLRSKVDPDWLAVIDQSPVEGCFARTVQRRRGRQVHFEYECPQRWDDLRPTSEDHFTRFCADCKKRVFYCSTLASARRHAARGHCIAVDSSLMRTQGDVPFDPACDPRSGLMVLGMASPPAPRYRLGQRVRIRTGPHRGAQGDIRSLQLSQLAAKVRIEGTGTVEVNFEDLEPVW